LPYKVSITDDDFLKFKIAGYIVKEEVAS